jgi:protein O-GlcNAc transferase
MAIAAESLETLLAEINGGRAERALPELEQLLVEQPGHPGLLTLRAEALRLTGRLDAAVAAFQQAGESGAGPRNWLIAGLLLANGRNIEESLRCLQRALAQTPDSEDVLDALITTLFNSSRHSEGIEFARKQLRLSTNTTYLQRAALLLHAVDLYEESTDAFRKIIALAPDDPALVGSALVPTRFTCEWELIEQLQRTISACYERGDFAAPQEYPLTNLTWCADEACNLGVTAAYVARMVGKSAHCAPRPSLPPGQRFRIGYLSNDFRNHATMHLMAGLLESHDRSRFEVFAYDYSTQDVSEYRQRFLNAIEHHVPIYSLTDQQAAERIADDRLDILFDLKLYTGGGRAGILTYRPVPVQAAYLGFPGSAASTDVDYIISDRFVTPDSSAPHYPEKFCRLPHSYQCNDRKRFAAPAPGPRAQYGLPEHKVVFGAFNQSYKIDRGSFSVWLQILKEVPDSILWLLGQSPAAVANLRLHIELAGVDPERVVFAPFAQPIDHLTRLQCADAVLDALICNGHTTTSDALWSGVPVITARGRHFASRVSESLLNAMELPELVGNDADDMVRIAKRIGTDHAYRIELRAKVAAKRSSAPLFDTQRFTRDFESAIELMVERRRSGLAPEHIDVPDRGPLDPASAARSFVGRVSVLQAAYASCPLCDGAGATLGFANCTAHTSWHEPLPPSIEWLRCTSCEHVYTRHYWTEAGVAEIARKPAANPLADSLQERRAGWTMVAEKVVKLLGGAGVIVGRVDKPMWVDIGSGDGSLVMTAADYGFAAIGLDTRADLVSHMQQSGFNAMQRDFMTLRFDITPDVLSMGDVLALMSHPREALRKAGEILRPGGVLVLTTPDLSSSGWRFMESQKSNPYWMDLERFHMFGRERLVALLGKAGFEVADFSVSSRSAAHMELYAVRKASAPSIESNQLAEADAICLERYGGMGDVLMAMGAAKALKSLSGRPVILATAPGLRELAQACPYIDHVVDHPAALASRFTHIKHVNLNPVSFGISRSHQIDAYLEAFGVAAKPELKNIEIRPDPAAEQQVETLLAAWPLRNPGRARILLHATQGDANRSWPQQRWEELASRLVGLGHQVIFIGRSKDPQKPEIGPDVPGTLSAVDALDPLATCALMRRSDLFVSTDSGPVQLAAATDIAIVGLYSAVAGSCRLPFRHGHLGWRAQAVGPSCSFAPCYQQMHDGEIMAPFMEQVHKQQLTANELFANWCPDGGSFACLKQQITVAMVLDAIGRLDSSLIEPRRRPTRNLRQRLDLSDVTVCAADSATPALAAWALEKSTAQCAFGDAILFTEAPVQSEEFRTIPISPLNSRAAYSRFVLQELIHHIRTPYVLIVQWDGYVIEPKAWIPEFFQYDWIGAKWPWHTDGMTVGNGGFSLRSRKLLEITGSSSFQVQDDVNEDDLVCRAYRPELMRKFQIRFAPEEIADQFSYENSVPSLPTFGFHAPFNMWRHVDDTEMIDLAAQFSPHIVRSGAFVQLLAKYAETRRFNPLRALYGRWRQACTLEEIRSQILQLSGSQEYTDALVGLCEPLRPS